MTIQWRKAGIPWDRHRHRHPRRLPREAPRSLRAPWRARKSACPATSPFSLPRAEHAQRSSPTCPTRALFLTRMSIRDARVYTCTEHDKLSCTRLQNYTIGASLKSVSVPWNSSLTTHSEPPAKAAKHGSPVIELHESESLIRSNVNGWPCYVNG